MQTLQPFTKVLDIVRELRKQGIYRTVLSNTIEAHAKVLYQNENIKAARNCKIQTILAINEDQIVRDIWAAIDALNSSVTS